MNMTASSLALEGALQALPQEVAECETGTTLKLSVHELGAINSVLAQLWSTVQLAANLDDGV